MANETKNSSLNFLIDIALDFSVALSGGAFGYFLVNQDTLLAGIALVITVLLLLFSAIILKK